MTAATPESAARHLVEVSFEQSPPAWDELVPGTENGFYDTRAWHLANTDLTGAEPAAMVAWDPEGSDQLPRAVLPVYRYANPPGNPALNPATLLAAGGLDPAAWGPITLLGTTVGYETVPLCKPNDSAWWARAAEQVCAGTSGSVLCLYLDQPDALRLAAELPDAQVLLTQARTVMPILGSTLPEHLAALTLKQRRKATKEPARLAETGRQLRQRPLRLADLAMFLRLQMSTQRKHGAGSTEAWFTVMFERYAANPQLQQSAIVFLIEHDGVPIGYTLAFRHHDSLLLRAIGFDNDLATEGEYFSLLVHEPVRYCIENGLSRVGFGLGSYQQKLLRGGTLIPLYSLLINPPSGWTAAHTRRHNISAAEQLIKQTDGLLSEHELNVLQRLVATGEVRD